MHIIGLYVLYFFGLILRTSLLYSLFMSHHYFHQQRSIMAFLIPSKLFDYIAAYKHAFPIEACLR